MMENDGYYHPEHDPDGKPWEADIAPYLIAEEKPEPGVFEIGLVMAGAISAGCYAAGVLDYLFEALDAWEKAKEDPTVPHHKVRIRVIAGASAGGMNAAIAAGALHYDFPHIRPGVKTGDINNPFYTGWVKGININDLLGDEDLKRDQIVTSLLDCSVLQQITNNALNYSAAPIKRPYLDARVRYIFTQSSLQGIPYYFHLPGNTNSGKGMVLHKTYSSFSVRYQGQQVFKRRIDDIELDSDLQQKTTIADWEELGNAALGSGAFPIMLAPRLEKRNLTSLNWRFSITTEPRSDTNVPGSETFKIRQLSPSWVNPPAVYQEYIVDGGMMDNEPLELARTELAGLACHNPRKGEDAFRAVVMIDPFPQSVEDNPCITSPFSLFDSIKGIASTISHQMRFNSADLALAVDEHTYSRFLIAPIRSDDIRDKTFNDQAIASGSLGGFGGFLSEEFRHHDYMLGRRNCQQFLREYFSLPQGNPLFKAGDNNLPIKSNSEFPIIPLMRQVQAQEPLPAWPKKTVNLDELADKIDERARNIILTFMKMKIKKSSKFSAWVVNFLLKTRCARNIISGKLVEYIKKDFGKRNLPFKTKHE